MIFGFIYPVIAIIVPAYIINRFLLKKYSPFKSSINYLISGFVSGLILGYLFADSMHFPSLLFALLYFGMIGALLIIGLFQIFGTFKKPKNKFFAGRIGLFLAAVTVLNLVFYNYKGFAFLILNKSDISFLGVWLINFIFILACGLLFSLVGKLIHFIIKFIKRA